MSTRWRIFLAAVVLVVVPAGMLAGFFRQRLRETVSDDFISQWRTETTRQHDLLGRVSGRNEDQLQQMAAVAVDDNRLRLALVGDPGELAPFLRDYAGDLARVAQMDVLELLDADGVILSSAHYRNEFGTSDRGLLATLAGLERAPDATDPWLECPEFLAVDFIDVWSSLKTHSAFTFERSARETRLALVNSRAFEIGGRAFTWIGGQYVEFPDGILAVADTTIGPWYSELDPRDVSPASLASWGERLDRAWLAQRVPTVVDGEATPAVLIAFARRHDMHDQLRQIDQLISIVFLAVISGTFLLAAWLSGRLSRPLAALARQAARVDLDDPAVDLALDRRDEVGQLARVLDAMVDRLRSGARRLAHAEHRATLGEVARQVNHDLRNGITPVRNVVRHLGETAQREPDQLARVFSHRRGTLDSSLAYLEDLAGRYARLAPEARREPCDLAALAREAVVGHEGVVLSHEPDAPRVLADPVSLRRILDNLLRNALEALPEGRGAVEVRVASADDADLGPQCVLRVSDDGEGMAPEVRDHVLEDFFTTKPGGSGLGLSNVRRLAGDAGGRITIDSEPGRGTTITIIFPGAESES